MILLDDLLRSTDGELAGPPSTTSFERFCFDSRLAAPGELFVAVRTDRADGHDYVEQACQAGVAGVLAEKPFDLSAFGAICVVVRDTRQALQEWARYVLAGRGLCIVGITGSVGKTTTKEAVAAVLGTRHVVFKNRANFNGLYGLPIALGEILPAQRIAVLEMAADHFGEMRRLTEIAPPEIAIVTTVEPAHLETFGTLDAIAAEKSALVASLPARGLAILNADDPRVSSMAAGTRARVVTFGIDSAQQRTRPADFLATDVLVGRDGTHFTVDTPSGRRKVHLPLLGRHQVFAALAALAAGLELGVGLDEAISALAHLPPIPGRLRPLPGRSGSLLLDDSYGSSPAALHAALETLAALDARRRIAVLGDMLELGDAEVPAHDEAGRRAAHVVDLLVTKGSRARRIAESALAEGLLPEQVVVTYTGEDAARAVTDQLGPGDVVLIKGSLATRMEQIAGALMAEPSRAPDLLVRQDAAWQQIVVVRPDRPTWLEIDLGAIAHNVRRLKELAGPAQLLISLKADAYGHGAVQVAQTALLNGATWLGVACLSEALTLRQAGIKAPILVLGYTPAWQTRDAVRNDLAVTVFDLDVARALSTAARALDRQARVHIKLDTGMGRLGLPPARAVDFARALAQLPGIVVEGIFSHLSVADSTAPWEAEYTAAQVGAFERALKEVERAGLRIPLSHLANSAALLRTTSLPDGHGIRLTGSTIVRSGIAVYGLDPSPEVVCPADFRPALSWKTQVAQVSEHAAGSYIGYGATYRTPSPARIAVIPVGYADGFRRSPQHWGEVLVRGRRAPLVGRVCMDQTMVDVTAVPGARQGDEVVLIGRQGGDAIAAEQVAERLGTINYEVVSAILARVPRETFASPDQVPLSRS